MHRWLRRALALAVGGSTLFAFSPSQAQTETQLTNSGSDQRPSWSPDGTLIMFDSRVSGNLDVWTVPVAGGLPTQQTFNRRTDQAPDWSPDGTAYVFSAVQGGGNPNIFTRPYGGGAATLLHADAGNVDGLPEWSPDGSTVPAARRAPRRKAAPSTGALPGFCTSTSRNDPSPQATVRAASSTSPGRPALTATASARRTFRRPPPGSSAKAPGQGVSART